MKTPQQAPTKQQPISPQGTLPGYKNATRKAPPAPLDLSPRPKQPTTIPNAFADASESEYEDDPDSARAEQLMRGRRKTREDDDREREALARQEDEARSRSKKDKSKGKSKSKSKSSTTRAETAVQPEDFPVAQPTKSRNTAQPAPLRQHAASVGAASLPRNNTAPSLMSPGLPMSPRPGDRPVGAAGPRPPNTGISSLPMSPTAGLPLSPRPPRHALPMPPQTPLTFASPHLARAEQYNSLATQISSAPTSALSETSERASFPSNTPSDVYKGLVTEQYPDLLLPPNALPSIIVKTASSRMRPSRQSYIAPKQADDNTVFTIAVHQRSDGRQLWRAEKTLAALAVLDHQVKSNSGFRDRLPDKTLFAGHAPAKIDARRNALDTYFDRMLDSVVDEKSAKIVCRFLSTDALAAEANENQPSVNEPQHPGTTTTPPPKGRTRREGYLTKRGKNFGGWKARYFVLDGPALKYFEAPGGAQLGTIKLQSAQIGKQAPASGKDNTEDEENQFRHAFLILEPKRKDSNSLVRHVLCAESDEERDLWVDALLQYVDYRDDGEVVGGGVSIVNGPRSPRLQKSMGELRPPSGHDTQLKPSDALRYDQMKAGDAPVMGAFAGRSTATPPPKEGEMQHPQISGPSNAHVIHNAGDWGMKSPSTPSSMPKDKKRGLFNFRGRSSSDLAPQDKVTTPGLSPADGHPFPRAAFGVPLAEAVAYAKPAGINTDLPAVVYRCFEYLTKKHASSEEGIFRLSGSNTVIKGLRERFDHEGDVNLVAEDTYYDIHAVASLLKLYLRELPASILTRELHLDFLKCLDLPERDRIPALNIMVNRLPPANRTLLESLSIFLASIVNNSEINKMNVRNVGIVFAPTLNVPAPLITSFVEDQEVIFGEPIDDAYFPVAHNLQQQATTPTDLRSPRKQMFSDLPSPAYNQTQFQSFSPIYQQANAADTGMVPMQPSYQMAPQGDGGYGSLNDVLSAPSMQTTSPTSGALSVPKDVKNKRRESSMMVMGQQGSSKKTSTLTNMVEDQGGRF
ncbi:hypothetical protein AMS68_005601 [Peltaster fructicola]|uniref:RhoGAP-domain-containing protein n=1 Tax=Peltaster fructicola TaxID=286661 RepID=A0A6H0XZA1_9PEZI|nr:hypothetical protein AMS68_005601 [Peltaster fructicola]